MTLAIVINQTGKSAGVDGQAREDLDTGVPVSVAAVGGPFLQYSWTFISKAINIVAGVRATSLFSTPSDSSTLITPIDQPGTYLVQLAVDSGSGLGATDADVVSITFYAGPVLASDPTQLPRRVPAFSERRQHNVPDVIDPLGNVEGWSREWLRWFASIAAGLVPSGDVGQILTYNEDGPIAETVLTGWRDYEAEGGLIAGGYFSSSNSDASIGNDGSITGQWRVAGIQNGTFKVVEFTMKFVLGASFVPGTGVYYFRVQPDDPLTEGNTVIMEQSYAVVLDNDLPAHNSIGYCIPIANVVSVVLDLAPSGVGSGIGPTTPFTFAPGDSIRIQGSFYLQEFC